MVTSGNYSLNKFFGNFRLPNFVNTNAIKTYPFELRLVFELYKFNSNTG